jgi:hypothetical protein
VNWPTQPSKRIFNEGKQKLKNKERKSFKILQYTIEGWTAAKPLPSAQKL